MINYKVEVEENQPICTTGYHLQPVNCRKLKEGEISPRVCSTQDYELGCQCTGKYDCQPLSIWKGDGMEKCAEGTTADTDKM